MNKPLLLSMLLAALVPVHAVAGIAIMDLDLAYGGPPPAQNVRVGINTTYAYEYEYNLTNTGVAAKNNEERWIPVLSNRTSLSPDGTVHQQEVRITNESWGPVVSHSSFTDAKDNAYHYFMMNLAGGASWTFSTRANLTLRETSWLELPTITTALYNTTDPEYIRYTLVEEYINKSHPLIFGNASQLNGTNPFAVAKNVYQFVSTFLTYGVQPAEYGAEWAIENGEGDCTEFSYLMVAMLRACGIPARVLRGVVIASSSLQGVRPDYTAPVGSRVDMRITFVNGNRETDNLTGHAWVEFFVPGFGWITSDPTWANAGDYAARVDNVHVPFTNGVWIGEGVVPALPTSPTERLATIPFPIYGGAGGLNLIHDIRLSFTVIAQEIPKNIFDLILDFIVQNPLVVAGILAGIVVIAVISTAVKNRRASKPVSYAKRVSFDQY